MTTDLVVRSTDVPAAFDEQMRMAGVLAKSALLPRYLYDEPASVLLILMGARTLNISAFQGLQSLIVIEGKLGMDASLMRALMTRAGHKVRVVERTAKRAVVEVHRSDRETPYQAEFTYEDAVKAELTGKKNYQRWPKAMLVARATAIAFRDECADISCGVIYTPEELGAALTADGGVEIDNTGKVVLDGEAILPPTQDEVDDWASTIYSEDLPDVLVAWEQVRARRGEEHRVSEGAAVGEDGVGVKLSELLAHRLIAEVDDATELDQVRELWRVGVMIGAMELENENGLSVHAALLVRPGEIEKAAQQRAEQDQAAVTVIDVTLDDIEQPERPGVVADPEVVAAALATWDAEGEADSDVDPA